MNQVIKAFVTVALVILSIVVFGVLGALPVEYAWNYLLSGADSIIGRPLPALDFWHAWVLLILCGSLFKSSDSSSSK